MRHRRLLTSLAIAIITAGSAVATSGPASALAGPSNDNRANARVLAVPSSVQGTTVGATLETGEPRYMCGWNYGSVWYRVTVPDARGMVIGLSAHGNLDAILNVFKQRRSQLDPVACDPTDNAGRAAVGFRPVAGATYYIRVAEQQATVSDTFALRIVRGSAPAAPQGRLLPATGAGGWLDRVLHTDVAYHVYLRAGQPYRLNLVRGECMTVELFPPGTRSFGGTSPVWARYCAHIPYGIYTPSFGSSGRYFIRVTANPYIRTPQPYRLRLARAGVDDIAPGLLLRNRWTRTGYVSGGTIDVVDLYRFDVARRSALDLFLTTPWDRDVAVVLLTDTGRRIACGCSGGSRHQVSVRLARGRYYVAVRSNDRVSSRYHLTRVSRSLTSTRTRFNGVRSAATGPDRTVRIGVGVSPAGGGSATVRIEHLDPLQGWLPYRQRTLTLSNGVATWQWLPPTVGRWRARTEYSGTRLLAASRSGFAYLLVATPYSTFSRNLVWSAA